MGIDITYTLGARGVARLDTIDKSLTTSTAYRPTLDEPVIIKNESETVTLFSGSILSVQDRALGEPNRGTVTTINAADVTRALDARIVTKTYATGQTLKAIVTDLATYLAPFGITLDPGMASGATLGVIRLDSSTITAALNYLSDLTGWVWRIQPTKVLEMFAVGTKTASYSLTSSNAKVLGGVQWSKTRGKFVNRQFVKYGTDAVVRTADVFTATASQSVFTLTYPAQAYSGLVWVTSTLNADGQSVTGGYAESASYVGEGATWEFNLTAGTMTRTTGGLAAGTSVIIFYPVQYPLTVSSEDSASVAALGPWEDTVTAPDILSKTAATDLSVALLRRYKVTPRQLTIATRAGMVYPGDTITLTIPERTVSGSWLITGVTIRTDIDRVFRYTLTCLEGAEAQESWIDYFRTAFGGGPSSAISGSISGTGAALTGQFTGNVTANYSGGSGDSSPTEIGHLVANILGAGAVGGGIDMDSTGSSGGRFSMIAGTGGPISPPERGLAWVDRGGSTQRLPMFLWWRQSKYYLTPESGTNLATPCHVGDIHQTAGSGRWHRGYFKGLDVGTSNADNSADGVISASAGFRERARTVALGQWADFSPAWTNLTVGNGTVVARWTQLGITAGVHVKLTFGSTTVVSGGIRFTMPVGFQQVLAGGPAEYLESGGGYYPGVALMYTSSVAQLYTGTSPRAVTSATVPFTWGTDDILEVLIFGEETG